MPEIKEQGLYVPIEEELKHSYLTYAMSVIVSRALPDVRDGLKPSQRRILVAMNDLGLGPRTKHRKCAKIAGDTSGNYHPHGEGVIYPTLVRMAQPFNMRYPLIDGQGNFGSLDGDPPAAMRYTEARMTSVTIELLEDIEKDTVEFVPNYDETRQEPVVLPAKFPNLLVNGSQGIAVGMATSIPPHNLGEVCDGIIHLLDHPNTTLLELCQIIQGPDFPTGAIICGRTNLERAYCTGRSTITLRAKAQIEEIRNKTYLIFTEIPYQVNKARILENIAELVKEDKMKGVNDIRDESDREHAVRIVVEIKRGEDAEVVLNQLYKFTSLQSSFSINMIALVDGKPQLLNIKQLVEYFIQHREQIIRRRTQYLLDKALARVHIVDGLMLAIQHIDAIIRLIRQSPDVKTARESLMTQYSLSQLQSDAILQMRLSTLTSLEYGKLNQEQSELMQKIAEFRKILSDEKEIQAIIRKETLELKERYSTPRLTQIGEQAQDIAIEDMIADEHGLVLMTHTGYIKRTQLDLYRKQNRGGSGVIGADIREGDFVEHLFSASAKDHILFFTDHGKCYWLKVYDIPTSDRNAKGRAVINLLNLGKDEIITSFIPVKAFDDRFLMMVTAKAVVKKTPLKDFARPNRLGIRAIELDDGDRLIATRLTKGDDEVIVATALGKAARFSEKEVRSMGRTAHGVQGVRLAENDQVIGMAVVNSQEMLLTLCEKGVGKRSPYEQYRTTRRGASGVLNFKLSDKTGKVIAILSVQEDDEIMAITSQGKVIRTSAALRISSRATQGVRVIKLKEGDNVVSVTKLAKALLAQENGDQLADTLPKPLKIAESTLPPAKDLLYSDEMADEENGNDDDLEPLPEDENE